MVPVLLIFLRGPEGGFLGKIGRKAEIRVCPCLELAVLGAAVYAAQILVFHVSICIYHKITEIREIISIFGKT